MQANREELVERLKEVTSLLMRYRMETPAGHSPHMICHQADAAIKRSNAAIAELTQAPAVPSDALRSALEEAKTALQTASLVLFSVEAFQTSTVCDDAVEKIDQALSRPAEPVQGEVTEATVERIRDALWDHFCPGIRRLDCDDEFYETAARKAIRAMQAAAAQPQSGAKS